MERIRKAVEKEDILNVTPRKSDTLMDYIDYGDEDVRRRDGVVGDLRQFIKTELCWKKELMDSTFYETIKGVFMGITEIDRETIEKLVDMVHRCDTTDV